MVHHLTLPTCSLAHITHPGHHTGWPAGGRARGVADQKKIISCWFCATFYKIYTHSSISSGHRNGGEHPPPHAKTRGTSHLAPKHWYAHVQKHHAATLDKRFWLDLFTGAALGPPKKGKHSSASARMLAFHSLAWRARLCPSTCLAPGGFGSPLAVSHVLPFNTRARDHSLTAGSPPPTRSLQSGARCWPTPRTRP